ncbi:MAG: Deoxyhypusine synthase [Thermoproteota archaeon]|nr:Deoxyhypusine synthase [Thermoproteota archaeon]
MFGALVALKYVEQMRIHRDMSVGQLVAEMNKCGVLGAGRLARATDIMREMFRDKDYTIFLALAGPMIPGGLRSVIGTLIDEGYVHAIVTSGANIVHDVIEGLGFKGVKGSFLVDDANLRKEGIGRVGDIFLEQDGFMALEKKMYQVFNSLIQERREKVSIRELVFELGKALDDEDSLLKKASEHNIPVFSPGLLDSMIGLHLWTFNQLKKLQLDSLSDLTELSDIVFEAKKVGAIILGGGLPKHHVLGANILREGVDAAVQVTLDRPEGGSLSGAYLEEGISWKKVKTEKKLETVIGDATIVFPIMVAAALEKLDSSAQVKKRRIH